MSARQPPAAADLAALYARECARLGHEPDPAQQRVIASLDDLRRRLSAPAAPATIASRVLGGWLARGKQHPPERGLYLWGGVGRGKTWLMDLFFHAVPLKAKERRHFHRFMQLVHDELKKHRERADPLEAVAEKLARRTRLLCFDELFVSDIADAMLLGNLFRGLFARGVTLVATSNVPPEELYRDGLQRARFLPAIELLKQHTSIVHLDGGTDYRLRLLERAPTWFDSTDAASGAALERLFASIAGEPGASAATLTLNHRRLHPLRLADDAIWFSFKELCDGPRGQADYIELARCYHTVFLSEVPVLGPESENQARRFIALVDELYDRAVKLIVAAARPAPQLYQGTRLAFEFERAASRLIEMQSQQYLARPHRGG